MNVLFFCRTPYNVFTATQIALQMHKQDTVDIMLFNSFPNFEKVKENLEKIELFNKIYICNRKKIYQSKKNIIRKLLGKFFIYKKGIEMTIKYPFKETYDIFYTSIIGDFIENRLIKKNKRKAKKQHIQPVTYLFEEGIGSYMKFIGNFYSQPTTFFKKIKGKLRDIKIHKIKVSKFFVFSPELLEWDPPFPIVQIEKISKNDEKFIKIVNTIFNYNDIKDHYDKKILFFEECYFSDGVAINDMDVIDDLINIVGKENIFIKIHPRNKFNRFKEIGIQTNENTEVPWEVIALNINLEDKILITITSGAVLNILTILGIKPQQVIMLFEYDKIKNKELIDSTTWQYNVCNQNRDIVKIVHTKEELKAILCQDKGEI